MDKSTAADNALVLINHAKIDQTKRPSMIKAVCAYFDLMKGENISQSDMFFMHYLANQAGLPQYYSMLETGDIINDEISLLTISNFIQECDLVVGEDIMLHRYQKEILNLYHKGVVNRYFLSAATSFGKTFLIYEIIRKMDYSNIALIFPTLSLLSENLFKIYTQPAYQWIKDNYSIHTLSDVIDLGEKNIFIYTPERYLSFIDKNEDVNINFVFVDEVYKLDNGFIIDDVPQENERDLAYRIALCELLKQANTDALLVGPYIKFPRNGDKQSSFSIFLERYGFTPIDYNQYDIVNKKEIIIKSALNINVEKNFSIKFTSKSLKERVPQLVKQLVIRGENTIIYCSTKSKTEEWANVLLNNNADFDNVNNPRVSILLKHIANLFADRKGYQWIVFRALKQGIGIHHGLVPKYLQQEIISLFNEGILKVLICTTTITEGVNTTAKNIIVLSGKKGKKLLKKFDAQNIEGRAGRFMHHYSGRVFIFDDMFSNCINAEDSYLQHNLFDKESNKNDVDILFTDEAYLNEIQKERQIELGKMKKIASMPDACFEEFRTIPYEDKIHLYNSISRFSASDHDKIKVMINHFIRGQQPYNLGLELICQSVRSIITNEKLRYLVENRRTQQSNCYLVGMISSFVSKGFVGSANYYIKKEADVDKGIRLAAEFVFNILRYQVVKYFGLFNMLYKNFIAQREGINISDVVGIDALLIRLEYNANTLLGRRVSDIGASFKVIEYYDNKDNIEKATLLYSKLDSFEKNSIKKIDKILG